MLEELARRHDLSTLLPTIRRHLLPAIGIAFDPLGAGRSRLGGSPLLPRGFEWPTYVPKPVLEPPALLRRLGFGKKKEEPLDFLMQIDLAELQAFEPASALPSQGLLTFFYDTKEQPWGYDPTNLGGFRVALIEDDVLIETPPRREPCCDARSLRFWNVTTAPSSGSRAYDALEREIALTDSYFEFSYELSRLGAPQGAGGSQLFGHSENIQGDMQLEAQLVMNGLNCGDGSGYDDPRAAELKKGADDWTLLLQIDSDEALMWGDGGMLYYWIRKADLADCRFDRCWMTLQCT